jgi:hypothetical protein
VLDDFKLRIVTDCRGVGSPRLALILEVKREPDLFGYQPRYWIAHIDTREELHDLQEATMRALTELVAWDEADAMLAASAKGKPS